MKCILAGALSFVQYALSVLMITHFLFSVRPNNKDWACLPKTGAKLPLEAQTILVANDKSMLSGSNKPEFKSQCEALNHS